MILWNRWELNIRMKVEPKGNKCKLFKQMNEQINEIN